MKKKGLIITLSAILFAIALIVIFYPRSKVYLTYENAQYGLIASKNKVDEVYIEDEKFDVYQTFSDSITFYYQSYNLDNQYNNKLIINDTFQMPLIASEDKYATFLDNKMKLLGLNIVNGELKISICSGVKNEGNLNTFTLRNVFIKVGNQEIWSEEYPKEDYLNEPINFGEHEINSDLRFDFRPVKEFTFIVDKELLNAYGTLLEVNNQKELNIKVDGKEHILINESAIEFDVNIINGETINETKQLVVSKISDIKNISVKMDGVSIKEDLIFNKSAWSSGAHYLEITAENKHGFLRTKIVDFNLGEINVNEAKLDYQVYQVGVSNKLYNGINNIGALVDEEDAVVKDDKSITTSYSNSPVVTFVINKSEKTSFNWIGKVNTNRTAFMQIYNHNDSSWETVSTAMALGDEKIQLGYDYQNQEKYIRNNLIYVRVSSAMDSFSKIKITNKVFHASDIQYINQLYSLSTPGSVNNIKALNALESMVDYIIDSYENNNMEYLLFTGDFVQQQKGVEPKEWKTFVEIVLNPLLAAGVPLGVSSGNHDVGGVSSYNPDGGNALDAALVYDYYWENLGEDVFKDKSYYGESFQNNRSHFDLITIQGHEFLFLYLGWGSSIYGIHVSNKDIAWAKTVLEKFPDKTVVLSTHEYMQSNGKRSITGEYVYKELVLEYSNIQFVFSGHINGSSKRADQIDDDGDGIFDRIVLQLLTNFQEEEALYGATFIRTIGLDFKNNYMYFNLYSPFFKDSDIDLVNNVDYVKDSQDFYYAYDLNNVGYGILTDYFG